MCAYCRNAAIITQRRAGAGGRLGFLHGAVILQPPRAFSRGREHCCPIPWDHQNEPLWAPFQPRGHPLQAAAAAPHLSPPPLHTHIPIPSSGLGAAGPEAGQQDARDPRSIPGGSCQAGKPDPAFGRSRIVLTAVHALSWFNFK